MFEGSRQEPPWLATQVGHLVRGFQWIETRPESQWSIFGRCHLHQERWWWWFMVVRGGCHPNCDDHHLALMVTRGVPINNCNSSYQKYLKAKYHFENSSGSKYALQHINNQCENWIWYVTREISKEFYLLTESFCIVHRSLIIFQSIKIKVWDPSLPARMVPTILSEYRSWKQQQIFLRTYWHLLQWLLHCDLQLQDRHLYFNRVKILDKNLASVFAALGWEFGWKG